MAKIFKIDKYDVANGPGVRTSIWFSGCNMRCPGCHNEQLQSYDVGEELTDMMAAEILVYLKDPQVNGRLSILGGEPMSRVHIKELNSLLYYLKHKVPNLNVWLWTGHEFEYLLNRDLDTAQAIELCNVIIDGPYIQELKTLQMPYQGSQNQRVINVQESLKNGYTIEM